MDWGEVDWNTFGVSLCMSLEESVQENFFTRPSFRDTVDEVCEPIDVVPLVVVTVGDDKITLPDRVCLEIFSMVFYKVLLMTDFCKLDDFKEGIRRRLFSVFSSASRRINWACWEYFIDEHLHLFEHYNLAMSQNDDSDDVLVDVAIGNCLYFLFGAFDEEKVDTPEVINFVGEIGSIFRYTIIPDITNMVSEGLETCRIRKV